ncbi:hypothetical protein PHLCEN_2v7720 [Hermanssonia centrifuga]|uniref:Uncharacterized protein n=1 Tax=Hermanssonia centrifuga TaxID=98765 RepID=A0A2R6NVQ1_9APHY|nr:hypothetical protein PHLCEN_2v7720 [Hermanssonia centrifuga]
MDANSDSEAPPGSPNSKRSRRQVAYYPNMNSINKPLKPFSRSAAKRESVMALGSIEHLQHYFTKTGIAAEKNPSNKPGKGMVPAIGGLDLRPRPPLYDLREFELPQTPVVPQIVQPAFPPFIKTYEIDPENLRPTVIEDLGAVEQAWWLTGIQEPSLLNANDTRSKSHEADRVDVLDLLRTTTHAVRSVRNYLLSLPDDSTTPVNRKPQFRPNQLSSSPLPKRQASQPDSAADPHSRIRRSALEVLTVLRAVEETSRLPLSDDAYDAQSDHGEHASASGASNSGSGSGGAHSRAVSPDYIDADTEAPVSISYLQVGGRHEAVPVWEDEEDYDLNQAGEESRQKRDRWDERLVLGGGWLYQQDVRQTELAKEREVVARYLDVVDEVLFGGRKDGTRGWVREHGKAEKDKRNKDRRVSTGDIGHNMMSSNRSKRRVVSTGMLDTMRELIVTEEPEEVEKLSDEESVEDDDLPDWAKRTDFIDDPWVQYPKSTQRGIILLVGKAQRSLVRSHYRNNESGLTKQPEDSRIYVARNRAKLVE